MLAIGTEGDVQLEGVVERITFRNPDNHYTVARVKVSGHESVITVVGHFPSFHVGERVRFRGTWTVHPEYGRQFRAGLAEAVVPTTKEGIVRFLASGLVKGVGPALAQRIVERFGDQTLSVIEETPERLAEVPGLGAVRRQALVQALSGAREARDALLFLQGLGVSPVLAGRIYKQYGTDTVRVIRENPFRLAQEVLGVGFLTADRIASALGISADHPARAEAAVIHLLHQAADAGHVFLPRSDLLQAAQRALSLEPRAVAAALWSLMEQNQITLESRSGSLADPHAAVYLWTFAAAEQGVSRAILELLRRRDLMAYPGQAAAAQLNLGVDSGFRLSSEQQSAVAMSLIEPVLIITGGPGTGKTTVVRQILAHATSVGWRVLLGAPTGRAAQRLKETSGQEARTLHRLLEFTPGSEGRMTFQRGRDKPLEADLIVIDEASMIDILLMYHLLQAVPETARLVLVGDIDQLPPVGPGQPFADFIGAGKVPVVRLTEIFRQAQESGIVMNAHRINQGLPLEPTSARRHPGPGKPKGELFHLETPPEAVPGVVVDLVVRRLPAYIEAGGPEAIQVLTPVRRGPAGVEALNGLLQEALNPARPDRAEVVRGPTVLREGDRVMQLKNNYQKGVFNGDIGRIERVDADLHELVVAYPDLGPVTYTEDELGEITLAYAISVHKSQGSEYPVIVMPVMRVMPALMTRNLLYTAITRARQLVVLVGRMEHVSAYIRNDRVKLRYSALRWRISGRDEDWPTGRDALEAVEHEDDTEKGADSHA